MSSNIFAKLVEDLRPNNGPLNQTKRLGLFSKLKATPPPELECSRVFTCDGKPIGFYQNIHNCSTFFSCQSTGLYTIICPAGEEFNPILEYCEEGFQCNSCPPPSIPPFCLQPFSCAGKSDGCHKDPWDCKTYYYCIDGEIYTGNDFIPDCPPGTKYDPDQKKCVSIEKAKACIPDCPNERPETPPTTTFVPPTSTTAPTTSGPVSTFPTTPPPCLETCTIRCDCKPDGVYPSPYDCAFYFVCSGSGSSITNLRCPDGKLFNPATKVCELPEEGGVCWNCVPGTEISTIAPHTTLIPSTLATTQAPTTQAPTTQIPTTQATTTQIPTTLATTTPSCVVGVETCKSTCDCKPDGRYPSADLCFYYYECTGGNFVQTGCPLGTLYNPVTQVCDGSMHIGSCYVCVPTNEQTTTVPPTTTTLAPIPTTSDPRCIATCEGKADGNYPNPTFCDWFYTCSGGIKHLGTCPTGQNFNPATSECEGPEGGGVCFVC